jgi:hypothetical protein
MGFLPPGPFSCLAGARSLDFGGKRGSAAVEAQVCKIRPGVFQSDY